MGNLKREYLTTEERNFYMVAKSFVQNMDGLRSFENRATDKIWDNWNKRGMITPNMTKNIKMANTYLKKFLLEVEQNLNRTERAKLKAMVEKFDYKLVTDYQLSRLLRDISNNLKYAVFEREIFQDVIDEIANCNCVGCTKNYENCNIYKMFNEMHLEFPYENSNCPFSCELGQLTPEEQKRTNEIRERMKSKGARGIK